MLPVGAMIISRDMEIQFWNQALADWSGIPSSLALGQNLIRLFPNVGEGRYLSRLTQVFDHGLPVKFSASFHNHFLLLPARHGLNCEWMIQQTDVRRMPENADEALVTIQDVSHQHVQLAQLKAERMDLVHTRDALTQSNEKLKVRNQELDEFNYVASHDLQEPLRKISTFTQFLEDDLSETDLSDDCVQYLQYIQNSAERMRSLVRDLLSLSQTGTQTLCRKPIDLDAMVDVILSDLQIRIQETSAVIVKESLPTVLGDSRMLSQLLQNLIANALKFIGDATPEIHITGQERSREWIISVEDNGIGIKPEFAEQIFKPFKRLHATQKYAGTGIGLAICKKAVARHGGRIWIDGNEKSGSSFRFTIPKDEWRSS
jgi:light-regulated signal transduction histidine kinase (bacteriophytochrome)